MRSKGILLSLLSGIIFAAAWWLLIDGIIHSDHTFTFAYSLPAIFCTLAGIGINMVHREHITDMDGMFNNGAAEKTRAWIFIMVTISFVCIGGSIWVLVNHYNGGDWPGVALLLNTMLVLFSAVLFFVG